MIPSPAYVYLLQSLTSGRFYLGWTTDIQRRLFEHNCGESIYTKNRGPWQLVGFEMYENVQDAKKREKTLKRSPRMLMLFKKRMLAKQNYTVGEIRQVMGMIPPPVLGTEGAFPPSADKQVVG